MFSVNQGVNGVTWMLIIEIFGCLSVAALGGLFEAPWLAYFWYAALAGITSLILFSLLLALGCLWNGLIRRARELIHQRHVCATDCFKPEATAGGPSNV
jgi:hypothetical protein